jgi:hypothetical protein
VVVVKTPDGPDDLTKGKELLQKIRDGDIDSGEILTYQCTLPVFGEVLFHAFGDGAPSCEGAKAA